jgi:hypothetical protein
VAAVARPDGSGFRVLVPPGAATIPVTITPSTRAGSVMAGTLYLDDLTVASGGAGINQLPPNINEAGDVEAIPYAYTVGPPSSPRAHVRHALLRK